MILYKYATFDIGLMVLRSSKIRFTQLASLNDAFESFPPVDRVYTDDEFWTIVGRTVDNPSKLQDLLLDFADQLFDRLSLEQQKTFPKPVFSQYLLATMNSNLAKQGKSFSSLLKEIAAVEKDTVISAAKTELVKQVANSVGVLSLTQTPDDEKMWSIYAQENQGIAIGFDSSSPFFKNAFPISYRRDRPRLNMNEIPSTEKEWNDSIRLVCGTKNETWAYEHEYRLALPIGVLEKTGKLDSRNNPIYVCDFPLDTVKEIVFGALTGRDQRESIVEASSALSSKVNFRFVRLDTKDYSIHLEPYDVKLPG